MQMEFGAAEILKMMEAYFGRGITGVFLAIVMLGLSSLMIGWFWKYLVSPLKDWLTSVMNQEFIGTKLGHYQPPAGGVVTRERR